MSKVETLCKSCDECKTLFFKKTEKYIFQGEELERKIDFIYCKGNEDLILNNTIKMKKNYVEYISPVTRKNRIISTLLRPDDEAMIRYINKNTKDIRLKNLRVSHPPHLQKKFLEKKEKKKEISLNTEVDTLCKSCDECKTLFFKKKEKYFINTEEFERKLDFIYCKGNKDIITNNTIRIYGKYITYISPKTRKTALISNLLKHNDEDKISYINKNTKDIRLKNIQVIYNPYLKQKVLEKKEKEDKISLNLKANTLCKTCDECKTLLFKKTEKYFFHGKELKRKLDFIYCKGNKDIILNNTIRMNKKYIGYISPKTKKIAFISNLLKHNDEDKISYINKNTKDIRLKNIRVAYHPHLKKEES